MPPSWAMAIANRASVTVSIAALTMGMFRTMFRDTRVLVSTSLGSTCDLAGTSTTSSYVKPTRTSFSNIAPYPLPGFLPAAC